LLLDKLGLVGMKMQLEAMNLNEPNIHIYETLKKLL